MHADVYDSQQFLNHLSVMATDDHSHFTCELAPQCLVSTTGKCLKGYVATTCPHSTDDHDELEDEDLEEEESEDAEDSKGGDSDPLNAHDTDEEDAEDEANESSKTHDSIYFGDGEALPESKIQTITYAFPTKLILFIGGVGCGKTTLVSAIAEAFQKGPLGDFIFAGSRTLVGFEQRSHLARRGADRVKPETERTKSMEFLHLHLSIRDKSAKNSIKHLLFTDISGERFENACATDKEMQSLTVLKRADHIFYVVNGEALNSLNDRFKEQEFVESFLERAIKNNLLSEENKITVLINKFDAVLSDEDEKELKEFFTDPLKERFASIITGVHETVARPGQGRRITEPQNLDILLHLCVRNREYTSEAPSHSAVNYTREFYRLFSE
jgi:energy-coupling factor transporter ATP-binding protein EcfA2